MDIVFKVCIYPDNYTIDNQNETVYVNTVYTIVLSESYSLSHDEVKGNWKRFSKPSGYRDEMSHFSDPKR